MKTSFSLGNCQRKEHSYLRGDHKGDVLYWFFRYREITVTIPKRAGIPLRVEDRFVEDMQKHGFISRKQKEEYENAVRSLFSDLSNLDSFSMEALYDRIHRIRMSVLGTDAPELEKAEQMKEDFPLQLNPGIDQRAKKETLIQRAASVILCLSEAKYFHRLKEDLVRLGDKRIYVLVQQNKGEMLPDKDVFRNLPNADSFTYLPSDSKDWTQVSNVPDSLQRDISNNKALLLAYGEDALLLCRDLSLDAIVCAHPSGFHAQAVSGQLGDKGGCVIYIPKNFDVTKFVPLQRRTQISFRQMAYLWQDHGDCIYKMRPEEWIQNFPDYFFNVYENTPSCPESKEDFPISLSVKKCGFSLEEARENQISEYLNEFSNCEYFSAYFNANGEREEIQWDAEENQNGILVHAARVKRAKGARVLSFEKGKALRQTLLETGAKKTALVSNFLFYLTPKLISFFNDLRFDRPMEQVKFAAEHLDYMLLKSKTGRRESFPLFKKTCIALTEDGAFRFFRFQLGAGRAKIGNSSISWSNNDVNPSDSRSVALYTPYRSLPDRDAVREEYRMFVGKDRVNFVIIGDRIQCIRCGDVILPGNGVVISLNKEEGEKILRENAILLLQDGYYDHKNIDFSVVLDPADGFSQKEWDGLQWAWGGGMGLISNKVGICDVDDTVGWFEEEGWLSPLSRQTQESSLHQLAKHPRTAIGTAENGDLLVMVFSGRTHRSTGADYLEMCHIARELFPDVVDLMNVDGGGSSVLGMVWNGNFTELSYPSTSTDSCVGMIRPVNTVLYIPLEKNLKSRVRFEKKVLKNQTSDGKIIGE